MKNGYLNGFFHPGFKLWPSCISAFLYIFFGKKNLRHKNAVFYFYLRVSRMVEGGTEIFCDFDQKNGKRKSYKKARVSLKSVLNSE